MAHSHSEFPLTIVQYWNTTEPPGEVLRAITGWKNSNPDFSHVLYSEESAHGFMNAHLGPLGLEAFDYCHHPAAQADLFRLGYLLVNGGVYVDADNLCVTSLSSMLRQLPGAHLVLELKSHVSLNNAFICCKPDHPVMHLCFDFAQKNLLLAKSRREKVNISRDTGPGVINDVVAGLLLDQERGLTEVCRDIALVCEQDLRSYVVEANMTYKSSPSANWRTAS